MNTFARTFCFAVIASAAALASTASCWQLAKSGIYADASASEGGAFAPLEAGPGADAPTSGDAGPDADASVRDGSDGSADGASDADAATTVVIPPFASTKLATGVSFGCRIDGSGTVWCWGDDHLGQTGQPPPAQPADGAPLDSVLGAQQVGLDAGLANVTALALGDEHACALTQAGTVYCWGRNDQSQLGRSPVGGPSCHDDGQFVGCDWTPTPVTNGVASPSLLTASGTQTCAVAASGSIQCWGGPGPESGNPDASLAGVTQIAVAPDHACALVSSGGSLLTPDAGDAGGTIECWGSNSEEQITTSICATNGAACPPSNTMVTSPTGVAAGPGFTCAAVGDGAVLCFGDNTYGELGHVPGAPGDVQNDGGVLANGTQTQVQGLGAVRALIATANAHAACALLSGGTVACWGNVAGATTGVPTTVSGNGFPPLDSIGAADSTYLCGNGADDAGIWCWDLASGAAPTQAQ